MSEYIIKETGYPGAIEQEVVQELVRCRDCIYCRKSDKGHPDADWCKRLICGTIKPDFYCADGERREDGKQ